MANRFCFQRAILCQIKAKIVVCVIAAEPWLNARNRLFAPFAPAFWLHMVTALVVRTAARCCLGSELLRARCQLNQPNQQQCRKKKKIGQPVDLHRFFKRGFFQKLKWLNHPKIVHRAE